MIKVQTPFPDFSLSNQDGIVVHLKDFKGKWLVLYVYPKDDTPGCTLQGKTFTETRSAFEQEGARVIGISADSVGSHKIFCDKFGFTIDLLADPELSLLKKLDVGQTEYKQVLYWDRTTFLVDPNGILRKVYEKVTPQGHEKVLLDDIKQLKQVDL